MDKETQHSPLPDWANDDYVLRAVNSYPAAQAMAEALELLLFATDKGSPDKLLKNLTIAADSAKAALKKWEEQQKQ